MRNRTGIPCSECGEPTWVDPASGRTSATHKACTPVPHGSPQGYARGCRCTPCRTAKTSAMREYRDGLRAKGIRLPGGSGPWINPKTRQAIYERDAWTCQLCGEAVDVTADCQSSWYPSLDHIVPQSKGGSHEMSNLRTAHRWCNSIRGAEDYHADLLLTI